MPEAIACVTCKKSETEAHLYKCPICFKYVCAEDAFNFSGRILDRKSVV